MDTPSLRWHAAGAPLLLSLSLCMFVRRSLSFCVCVCPCVHVCVSPDPQATKSLWLCVVDPLPSAPFSLTLSPSPTGSWLRDAAFLDFFFQRIQHNDTGVWVCVCCRIPVPVRGGSLPPVCP